MTYSSEVIADSPHAYWRLGESSGTTAADSSGNGRSATYSASGVAYGVAGLAGDADTAVTLDGTAGEVRIARTALNLSAASMTVEFIIKTTDPGLAVNSGSLSSAPCIVSRSESTVEKAFVVSIHTSGTIAVQTGGSYQVTRGTAVINDGARHHVAVYMSGAGTPKIYVDGILDTLVATAWAAPEGSPEFVVGYHPRASASHLVGTVDEVAVYAGELSSTRVAAHYAALSTGLDGTVVATSTVEGAVSATYALDGTAVVVSGVEGAFQSSGAVHALAGQVDATSGVEGTLSTVVGLAGQVDAVSGLQGSLGGSSDLVLSLTARASLTLAEPIAATPLKVDLTARAILNIIMARPTTVDPVTGLPQYRLVAVSADGTRHGEIPNAQLGDLVEELGLDGTRLDFTLPKYDATNAHVLPTRGQPIPEVQVWRGPNLETWQKVDGARPGVTTIDYDCSGLAGYLDGRLIGKMPKTDWLVNGDFSGGFTGWSFGYDEGSIPATQPKREIVDVDFFGTDAKALKLSGADTITTTKATLQTAAVFAPNSATFLSGGAALVTAKAEEIPAGTAAILIEGHTAYNWLDGDYGDGLALSLARANAAKPYVQAVHPTATITTVGKGRFEPLNDNSTYAEQAVNRRVEFHYTTTVTADADSAQWAKGSLTEGATVTVPASTKRALPVTFFGWALLTNFLSESKTGYGVHVTLAKAATPAVIVEEAHSTLDETTPTDDWTRHEATVTIPADDVAYILTVKFYAPGGVVLWTHGGVYPEEALLFPAGTDRALIVKGLIEHGQDPAVGKLGDTPILIGTKTPLTGRLTKATYPYHERRKVLDAVNEHAAVAHGVDLRLGHSDTERWVETHYPRLGSTTTVTLALGTNVIAYDSPIDVTSSGTRWIAQALESSGADREEGIYTDTSGLGGVLLERLAYSEPGTPVTELGGAAESASKRYGHPVADLTVTIGKVGPPDPALTSWMLDHVKVGDVVNVDINDGPIVHEGLHRVVRKVLTPDTDTLRYSLIPEV